MNNTENKVKYMLSTISLVILVVSLVSASWPHFQMAILMNKSPIPSLILKILLVLIYSSAFAISGTVKFPKLFIISWLFLVLYLSIDVIHLVSETNDLAFSLFSYNAYYGYLLLSPMVFILQGFTDSRKFSLVLTGLAIPLALFGILQFILKDPILPVRSLDGNFEVLSWGFYGVVRAHSLFDAPFEFGYFLVIIFGLSAVTMKNKSSNKTLWIFIMVIMLFAIYTTLTRLVYIEVAFSGLFLVIFAFTRKSFSKFIYYIPLVYLMIGIYVAFYLPKLIDSASNLASSATLNQRLEQWQTYWYYLWKDDNARFLFGTGIIQNGKFGASQDVLIDSVYVAIATHVGVVGLIMILLFMTSAWIYILRQTLLVRSPLNISIAALWSTYLASGVFNLTMPISGLLLMLFIAVNPQRSNVIGFKLKRRSLVKGLK